MKVVLSFLTELYKEGLGYSAINTARSALSVVVHTDEEQTIGDHPLVSRFVNGVFQLRTPLPHYSKTWDVSVLLEFFRG